MAMTKKQREQKTMLLDSLLLQGIRFNASETTIFFPYGKNPWNVEQIRTLNKEFHFAIQFEIV